MLPDIESTWSCHLQTCKVFTQLTLRWVHRYLGELYMYIRSTNISILEWIGSKWRSLGYATAPPLHRSGALAIPYLA